MEYATRNQLGNVHNPHQRGYKKVLCVCSAGLLRSPTLASVLNQELGYNTRAVGSCTSFALIPITEALIHWADEIIFVDKFAYHEAEREALAEIKRLGKEVRILNIPDKYGYSEGALREACLKQYLESA